MKSNILTRLFFRKKKKKNAVEEATETKLQPASDALAILSALDTQEPIQYPPNMSQQEFDRELLRLCHEVEYWTATHDKVMEELREVRQELMTALQGTGEAMEDLAKIEEEIKATLQGADKFVQGLKEFEDMDPALVDEMGKE